MLGAINAQGNFIPLFLVFPRVYFKEDMLQNASPGTVGVAHETRWMTGPNFLLWMDHFIKHKAYDVSGVPGESFHRAFCPANIVSGFKATGIYPFDPNIFKGDKFMSSFVTDRPETEQAEDNETGPEEGQQTPPDHSPVRNQESEPEHIMPEGVNPFPKAGARKQKRNRKKGRTSILTDTPEKNEIERIAKERTERCQRKEKQQQREESSESESDSEEVPSDLVDDSDESDQPVTDRTDDYVLVKLASKKVVRHYAGIVLTNPDQDDAVEVKFLSRMLTKTQPVFSFPDKEDIAEVDIADIVAKLPSPKVVGGTKRTAQQFIFDWDFSDYYRLY